MNYKEKLLWMIQNLLEGKWSVDEFEHKYCDYYIDGDPSFRMTELEEEFFSEVNEKLSWTSESPNEEDRSYGYVDHGEFLEWIKEEYEKYLKNMKTIVES